MHTHQCNRLLTKPYVWELMMLLGYPNLGKQNENQTLDLDVEN